MAMTYAQVIMLTLTNWNPARNLCVRELRQIYANGMKYIVSKISQNGDFRNLGTNKN